MRRVLVTGGAGFIGSNFIRYALGELESVELLVNLDLLTYAGNLENLAGVDRDPRYVFRRGDIRDAGLVRSLFEEFSFDTVINFAAESHVDRSITEPEVFITTNILGAQTLMDAAREAWSLDPSDRRCREYAPGARFLQVSTDEVYGALGPEGRFTEDSPIAPNSPYAASKAGAQLMARAYHNTYGFPVLVTCCSNNYGPRQFPEKLIPLLINNALRDRPIPIYGDGLQRRDWLHVLDHCSAILAVLGSGVPGQVYNIGGDGERTNLELIRLILGILGKPESLMTHVPDRPGHDRRYAIDSAKLRRELGWSPKYTLERGIEETVEWYLGNPEWLRHVTEGEYLAYYDKMYGK